MLGIGRSKLYALLAAGELPVVRIGRATRIPTAALACWVEARTTGGKGDPADRTDGEPGRSVFNSSQSGQGPVGLGHDAARGRKDWAH